MDPTPALLGAGAALVFVLAALVLRGEDGRALLARVLAAAAPVAAIVAAYLAVDKSLALWPPTYQGKLVTLAVAAAAAGVMASFGRVGAVLGVACVAALGAALFHLGTGALHGSSWAGQVTVHVAGFAGAAVLLQISRAVAQPSVRAIEASLATAIAALAASPLLGWTGVGSSAFMAAALSASAGLFGLIAIATPKARDEASVLAAAMSTSQSLLLVGLLAHGALFASTPLWLAAMVGLAPLFVILPGRGLRWALVRLTLVAALAGAAVGMAKAELDAKPENPYAEAYGK